MTFPRHVFTIAAGICLTVLAAALWYGKVFRQEGDGIRFRDTARSAGLNYHWQIAGSRPLDILQSIGNGCAFLDYDNDGNLDILLVGTDHLALYKGDGHGHFTDVTHAMGLDKLRGHFLGCAVGDYDNDGYDDVYVSGWHTGLLLHNDAGKRFTDVTQKAGLKSQPWGTSAAFADLTNNGKLDLYVGNYIQFDPAVDRRLCPYDTFSLACSPKMYRPLAGVLYHNLSGGKFQDVTRRWNADTVSGDTLGVAFADYDGSRHPSLYVANDESPGNLLKNNGSGFQDFGRQSGTALTAGQTHAGMGVDWGDYDNDGRLDIAVGTFTNEPKVIYHNESGVFSETSEALGLRPSTMLPLTFGVKWFDADNDGWLDLMLTNGHVNDNANAGDPEQQYRQPTQIFRNDRGKRFEDLSSDAGADLQKPIVGRGLAIGDYDNDGRVDALVVDSEGAPLLLHNDSAPVGHWLELTLIGTKSNRDGYGAFVTVTAEGLTQTRLCHADGSYLSSSDKRVHLGLGPAKQADTLTIQWPSGQTDTLRQVAADQRLRIREGTGKAVPLPSRP